MYQLRKQEPFWLDLAHGLRVKFAPATRSMRRRARLAARAPLAGTEEDEPDLAALMDAGEAFSRELIRLGIIEWDGAIDEAGAPVPVSAEAVEMLLADDEQFDAADRLYVLPVVERDREKNGSSASPTGIGEAATAASDIASSPVVPKPKRAAAKPARTGSKRSNRPKAKRPGTS